jgi:hypothetical protein
MRDRLIEIAMVLVGTAVCGIGMGAGYGLYLHLAGEQVAYSDVVQLVELAKQNCKPGLRE